MTAKDYILFWINCCFLLFLARGISFAQEGAEARRGPLHDLRIDAGINVGTYGAGYGVGYFALLSKRVVHLPKGNIHIGLYNNFVPIHANILMRSENFDYKGHEFNFQLLQPAIGHTVQIWKKRVDLSINVSGGLHWYTANARVVSGLYGFESSYNTSEWFFTSGAMISTGYRIYRKLFIQAFYYQPLTNHRFITPRFFGLGISWARFRAANRK